MTLLQGSSDIELALTRVGELLTAEGQTFAVVILGGAALNLLGVVERTTRDVDVLAFARPQPSGYPDVITEPPEPLPEALVRAVRTVGRDMALEPTWLNTGPALQWRQGLPVGLATRLVWRKYGKALHVGIVSRYDLLFFKLYAAVDSTGPTSVHYQDLVALVPSAEDLEAAARWTRTQDASPAFQDLLDMVIAHVRRDLNH